MRIYIGGLGAGTKTRDLDRLVRDLLRGPWYKLYMPRGGMADCKLVQVTEHGKRMSEYFALVTVEPRRMAWEVVHGLDGARLKGHVLQAHRWFTREGLAERRAMLMLEQGGETGGQDRRSGRDRRRNLEIRSLTGHLTKAVAGFERSHGN